MVWCMWTSSVPRRPCRKETTGTEGTGRAETGLEEDFPATHKVMHRPSTRHKRKLDHSVTIKSFGQLTLKGLVHMVDAAY